MIPYILFLSHITFEEGSNFPDIVIKTECNLANHEFIFTTSHPADAYAHTSAEADADADADTHYDADAGADSDTDAGADSDTDADTHYDQAMTSRGFSKPSRIG